VAIFPSLYRRPSGIYVVRLAVPQRLRDCVGKREIHVSTHSTVYSTAKLTALRVQLLWRERFRDLDMDLDKLTAGSPLLLGEGIIAINDAARLIGMSPSQLLGEMLNNRVPVAIHAEHWEGWLVPDLDAIERDYDDTFILNDVEGQGNRHVLSGLVRPYDNAATISGLIETGETEIAVALVPKRGAFFADTPQRVSLSRCMVPKSPIEAIRVRLARVATPSASAPVPSSSAAAPSGSGTGASSSPIVVFDPITEKARKTRFSELFKQMRATKKWKEYQDTRMATEASFFEELMDDPLLSEIDAAMIDEFASRMKAVPNKVDLARRRFGVTKLADVIDVAKREKLALKGADTIRGHVSRVSEILEWGRRRGMVLFNAAGGYADGQKRDRRMQDERDAFSDNDLERIFGADWFRTGAGEFLRRGFTRWRPYYYWLPLLGLCAGGRINELCQLHLSDIGVTDKGVAFIDFNLDDEDKTDADAVEASRGGKSLKTVNAIRVVPLHPLLQQLGFLDYVGELRQAGYVRLFPELRRDRVKGYGKPAGSWFNERYLGRSLGIVRDGRKTFHSFRHNFISAIDRLDVSESVIAQLAGHERGETQSGLRYRKDRAADELMPVIRQIEFACLNGIASFDVSAAMKALRVALRLKDKATG
jgi:integrase